MRSANKKSQTKGSNGNIRVLCNARKSRDEETNTATSKGQTENDPLQISQSETRTTPIIHTFVPDVRPVSVESIVVKSTPRQSFFVQSTQASVLSHQIVTGKLSIDEDVSIDQIVEGNQSIDDGQIAAGKRSIDMEDSEGDLFM
jgi:hypothetical protein